MVTYWAKILLTYDHYYGLLPNVYVSGGLPPSVKDREPPGLKADDVTTGAGNARRGAGRVSLKVGDRATGMGATNRAGGGKGCATTLGRGAGAATKAAGLLVRGVAGGATSAAWELMTTPAGADVLVPGSLVSMVTRKPSWSAM